jgi:hypothetical protein
MASPSGLIWGIITTFLGDFKRDFKVSKLRLFIGSKDTIFLNSPTT